MKTKTHLILTGCLLFCLAACRTYQHKAHTENSRTHSENQLHYGHQHLLKQDSNTYTRLWFEQGQLRSMESRLLDSLQESEKVHLRTAETSSKKQDNHYFYWIAAILVFGGIILVKNRLKNT